MITTFRKHELRLYIMSDKSHQMDAWDNGSQIFVFLAINNLRSYFKIVSNKY